MNQNLLNLKNIHIQELGKNILLFFVKSFIVPAFLGFLTALLIFFLYSFVVQDLYSKNVLLEANKAYELKKYSTAFKLYTEAQKIYPTEKLIYLRLANIAYQRGMFDISLNNFNRFIELGGFLDKDSRSKYGSLFFRNKEFNKVIEIFTNQEDIKDEDIYILANSYFETNNIQDYKENLNKIKQYKESFWDLQVFEKDINTLYSNLEKIHTLPSLNSVILNNNNFDIYSGLITKSKKEKDLGNNDYSEILRLTAFVNLNKCKIIGSELANLRFSWEQSKLSLHQIDLLEGKCANYLGDWEKAITLIQPLIDWDKSNIEYREELAYSFHLKGDKDTVLSIYDDILLIEKNSRIFENYAYYLYDYGYKKDALENLKNAFNLATDTNTKARLSKNILKISILDFYDTSICINTDFDTNLILRDTESIILKNICNLQNNKNIDFFEPSYLFYYFDSIRNGNNNIVNDSLDYDIDGLLNKYHSILIKLNI